MDGDDELPVKTADGVAELARRTRGLGQRYRTLLLLVDGRRTRRQVVELGAAAGVGSGVFDELVALGLVAHPRDASLVEHIELPLDDRGPAASDARQAPDPPVSPTR